MIQRSPPSGSSPPIVGRASELARLEELLDGDPGATSLVIVSGEGGVGKTRLVAEAAARAEARGWEVLRGRAYPVGTGVPYALFADAFLPLLKGMDPSTLTVLSRGGEAQLRYLFPGLGSPSQAREVDDGSDPEEFRMRLMWNFAELVKAYASRKAPILCVLEDLQWADDSSLRLLHFLARQVSGERILLLSTYNEVERERGGDLARTERSLVATGVAAVIRLERLALEEVRELIARTFDVDERVVGGFASLLFGSTRGNPFFIEEIVKSLVRSGRLVEEGGVWSGWDASDFGLPESIRDAVLGRVEGFSEDARSVAELAAVVGARSSYALLAAISGLDEARLLGALEELCAHGTLEEGTDDDGVVYAFSHPLVRQALYEDIGLQRARLRHAAVAEAMEAHYGPHVSDHAGELAYHFSRVGGTARGGKVVRYMAAAGMQALERRADHEAVRYLREAVERAAPTASDDAPARGELLPHLARALQHVGDLEAAAESWQAALDATPPDSPARPNLMRALGLVHFWCGRHGEAHRSLDAGLELAEAAGDTVAVVRLRVAKAHCLHEIGRGSEALAVLAPALPLGLELGDPGLLARVHRALALLYVWVGPPEKAEEHGERAIELALEVGDKAIEFWARWGLAILQGMRGETDGMAAAVERIEALAEEARSPVLGLWIADMQIELAYGRGRWDEGIALGNRAIALARRLGQRTLLPRLLVWTSQFHLGRGNLSEAEAMVQEAVAMAGLDRADAKRDVHQVVPAYIGLAHYLVGLGDYAGAIDAAQKGLEIAEGTGYTLWTMHRLLPILAEAHLWAEEVEAAAEVGARMREHAEQLDHRLGLAWSDACDAFVRWKRGDPEGAVGGMRRSAEALERIPMIPYAARIRRQLAGRLAEVGRIDEAEAELRRVHEVFQRLEAEFELTKTRKMFQEIGRRAPQRTRPQQEGLAALTPGQKEVAVLAARGLTNAQIGEELGCAQRTVTTQLHLAYRRLGLAGPTARAKLADLVREEGL